MYKNPHLLGSAVAGITDEAYACKKEDCAKYAVQHDLFDVTNVRAVVYEVYPCQNQSYHTRQGEDDPQCSLFHNGWFWGI